MVPDALRVAGWMLETMDERYGSDASQFIQDIQWIEEAAERGDVMLCKDLRVATNQLEADAVHRVSARVFGLARREVDGQGYGPVLPGQRTAHIPDGPPRRGSLRGLG